MPPIIGYLRDGSPVHLIAGGDGTAIADPPPAPPTDPPEGDDPDGERDAALEPGDPFDAPSENLVRTLDPGLMPIEVREEGEDGDGRTLFGHFAVFERWTEIHSIWEGHFMERFMPGAFRKTMREYRDRVRILFQHGRDPGVGLKPIAGLRSWAEDDVGAAYEARLLDAGYVEEVRAGLAEGLYGASMRFSVLKERWIKEPPRSAHNPERLPERSVYEARVPEFGPVTFPAYGDATAGVRSGTDDFIIATLAGDPARLEALLTNLRGAGADRHSADGAGADRHSGSREVSTPAPRLAVEGQGLSREEFLAVLRR